MNKNLLIYTVLTIAFAITSTSCKNKAERQNEKLQKDLKTYFVSNIKDSTSSLEKFNVVKIDSITKQILLFEQSSLMKYQLDELANMYERSTQKLSNSIDQIRLYRMIESPDLMKIEKKDFDKEKARGELINAEIEKVLAVAKKIDSTAKITNDTKPIAYQAKCTYQLRLKDKSIKQDTVYIILNIEKNIINRNDFIKLPYKVDFDKLN